MVNVTISNTSSSNKNISMVVTYTRGLSGRFKKTCNSLGIQVHFKGSNTIHTFLMTPKDKDNTCQKCGIIYWFQCPHADFPRIHRGIRKDLWGQTWGTSPSPIPYSSTQPYHRTSSGFATFDYRGRGGTVCHQDHKGGHVHLSKWPIPQQEPEETLATPQMGWGTTGYSITQLAQHHHPSFHSGPTPHPLTTHKLGEHTNFQLW